MNARISNVSVEEEMVHDVARRVAASRSSGVEARSSMSRSGQLQQT